MDILFMPTQEEVESFDQQEFNKLVFENGDEFLRKEMQGIVGVIFAIKLLNYTSAKYQFHSSGIVIGEDSGKRERTHTFTNELSKAYDAIRYVSNSYRVATGIPFSAMVYTYAPVQMIREVYTHNSRIGAKSLDEAYDTGESDGDSTVTLGDIIVDPVVTEKEIRDNEIAFYRETLNFLVDNSKLTGKSLQIFRLMVNRPDLSQKEIEVMVGISPKGISNTYFPKIKKEARGSYKLRSNGDVKERIYKSSIY